MSLPVNQLCDDDNIYHCYKLFVCVFVDIVREHSNRTKEICIRLEFSAQINSKIKLCMKTFRTPFDSYTFMKCLYSRVGNFLLDVHGQLQHLFIYISEYLILLWNSTLETWTACVWLGFQIHCIRNGITTLVK